MQYEVSILGWPGAPGARTAHLSTDHPLSSYGHPVLLIGGRAYTPAEALLLGWQVTSAGQPHTALEDWQRAVSRLRGR